MKTNGIDNDHCKNCAEDPLLSHNKMKPRIQDHGLTGDHAIPANGDNSDCNVVVNGLIARNQAKEFEEESEGMQHTAITGYQKRPEVQASMSFKGEEDLDIELGDVVPCDGSEGSYGHINALVERNWPPRFSFRYAHPEDLKRRVIGKQIVEGGEGRISSVES